MKRRNAILLISMLLIFCACSKKGTDPPPKTEDQYWLFVYDFVSSQILKIDTETDSLVDSAGYNGTMWGMTITPDDKQLWLSGDSQVVVYDAATLAIVGNASVPEAEAHFPPGKSYAVATDGRAVYFVDRSSLGVLDVDSTAKGMIATFLWPDSALLLGVNFYLQPQILAYNYELRAVTDSFYYETEDDIHAWVYSAAVHPDSRRAFSGRWDYGWVCVDLVSHLVSCPRDIFTKSFDLLQD